MKYLFFLAMYFVCLACDSDKIDCSAGEGELIEMRNGRLTFDERFNQYIINSSPSTPGNIDTEYTQVVCNLHDSLKIEDKKVTFDGRINRLNTNDLNLTSITGGEEFYSLILISIECIK